MKLSTSLEFLTDFSTTLARHVFLMAANELLS